MIEFHLLRVFLGPTGGGNPLAVFVDGAAVPVADRQAIAAELGLSETVFVDDLDARGATIAIHTPTVELPFAGHPSVGTSFLLRQLGAPVDRLFVAAGEVPTWWDGERTWIRARPEWVHPIRLVEFATPGEVEDLRPPRMQDPGYYAWAWEDAGIGELRARYFATDVGIEEDEATGAAAVVMGARFGRPLTIRQGVASELLARPGPEGTVEVGGRCGLVERRAFG